ncbi:MAG: Holliday junction branch migration DNA helicase RuvB, partial [Minisyncoccia bacterium]
MSSKESKKLNNADSNKSPVVEDSVLDQTLRPTRWEDYIGQKHIKDNIKILLRAAEERGHIPEHILFYGPPGLGKTTLAHL